jgi:cell division septation protein DedD
MVNKTVKIFSKDYHDQAENYTFKWQPIIGPNNEKIIVDLKYDMLIFTPETVGNYEVNLSIEDISEEVVAEEIFYFKAIPETTEVAIIEPEKEIQPPEPSIIAMKPETQTAIKSKSIPANNQKSKKTPTVKKQPPKSMVSLVEYAIQISAWPSLEEARKHQLELIDEGFDSYTQRFYYERRDEVWYRVRVGNFSNKNIALKVKKRIDSFTGITTWLDIVSIK